MQNFSSLALKLREEIEVTDGRTDGQTDRRHTPTPIRAHEIFCGTKFLNFSTHYVHSLRSFTPFAEDKNLNVKLKLIWFLSILFMSTLNLSKNKALLKSLFFRGRWAQIFRCRNFFRNISPLRKCTLS